MEPFEDGYLLEALETDPAYRKMGYAKKLIQAVIECNQRCKIYSHVHKRNYPSLATHEACGFTIYQDFARYISGTISCNAYTLVLQTD